MNNRTLFALVHAVVLLWAARPASAQWVSESYPLAEGYSAIWLSHDCTGWLPSGLQDPAPIAVVLANYPQIVSVWQWNPLDSTVQFTEFPALPVQPDTSWKVWHRPTAQNPLPDSTLSTLAPNAAYLIEVATGEPNFNLTLVGQPVLPKYTWHSSGQNFVGFPTVSPSSTADRNFERFFSFSAALNGTPPVYSYNGGPLSEVAPKNPLLIGNHRTTAVSRNKAYWVNSTGYSDYSGPLKITASGSGGLDFDKTLNTLAIRIKNVSDSAYKTNIIATLSSVDSAIPPNGSTTPPRVPLRVRGAFDPLLGFAYDPLGPTNNHVTLAPGEEKQIIFAVDRATMGTEAGNVFQSLLQVTDSLNLTRIDVPVRAVSTPLTGVWIGAALVTHVDEILTRSGTTNKAPGAPDGNSLTVVTVTTNIVATPGTPDGTTSATSQSGHFTTNIVATTVNGVTTTKTTVTEINALVDPTLAGAPANGTRTGINVTTARGETTTTTTTVTAAKARSDFPLRLVVHAGASGTALLQQVYLAGRDGTNQAGATEGSLGAAASTDGPPVRLSSASFPLDMNSTGGPIAVSGPVGFTVDLAHDAPSNPFLHLYHPDHDNRDERFEGASEFPESYRVIRQITLNFQASPVGQSDPTWGSTTLGGVYSEVVTGLRHQPIHLSGIFTLRRVSDAATLR